MRFTRKSLSLEFNKTAAAARAAFPDALDRLVVLQVPTADTPVYLAPAVAEKLTQDIAGVKKTIADLADMMKRCGWAGLANRHGYIAGTQVNLIALRDDLPGIFYKGRTKEMREFYVLDHELGHHVTPKGTGWEYSGQMKESSAEAYATLRHIQRFGKDTHFIKKWAGDVAKSIVLHADTAHYTTDTIHRVIQIAEEQDVSKLSLQETAALAGRIADDARLDEDTLEKVCNAYAPVSIACKKHIGGHFEVMDKILKRDGKAYDFFYRATISVMQAHVDDPDIFKAGKRFLTSYSAFIKFMKKQAKTDSFYKEALDFLKNDPPAQDAMQDAVPPVRPQGNPGTACRAFG